MNTLSHSWQLLKKIWLFLELDAMLKIINRIECIVLHDSFPFKLPCCCRGVCAMPLLKVR